MLGRKKKLFLCGVVEGFYGRPWTANQRFDLFSHLSKWEMNAYMYAPKDDVKHRADWRKLYSQDEEDDIVKLIQESKNNNVHFIYAISPGLDICYSDESDSLLLKEKLGQIASLGCNSFAILFDDIQTGLSSTDAKEFSSLAEAQVSVTNEIYEHFKRPEIFLFCPTEYCASRASPSVRESRYLNHVGECLNPSIDVLWTGPNVISIEISELSVDELTCVLRRSPVIWDNLHANDYDQRRLYLGPYNGRPVELFHKLNGVLTNPNCEYGANYIPIHTLAQWSSSGKGAEQPDVPELNEKYEEDDEGNIDHTDTEGCSCNKDSEYQDELGEVKPYDPKKALQRSVKEWYLEFQITRERQWNDKMPAKDEIENSSHGSPSDMTSTSGLSNNEIENSSVCSADNSQSDIISDSSYIQIEGPSQSPKLFLEEDLELLIDLFYLPHMLGSRAMNIIKEFCWLRYNAPSNDALKTYGKMKKSENVGTISSKTGSSLSDAIQELEYYNVNFWCNRAIHFHLLCEEVNIMYNRLTTIPNKALLYDLHQYAWDVRETTLLLDSYIAWLEAHGGEINPVCVAISTNRGVTALMEYLLPQVKCHGKLVLQYNPPLQPSPEVYTIRPCKPEDKDILYKICLENWSEEGDATSKLTYPNLLGDRFVGPYLLLSHELSFVLEDLEGDICGYILAALDSKDFHSRFMTEWIPAVIKQYIATGNLSQYIETSSDPEKSFIINFLSMNYFLPDQLQQDYPSHFYINLMKSIQGQGVIVRAIKMIMTALKARKSHGVHLVLSPEHSSELNFYEEFGFEKITLPEGNTPADNAVILGCHL